MASWNVISAYVLDFVFGYQSANKHRDNMIALASRKAIYNLGGSRSVSLPQVASAQDVESYHDIELDGTNLGGFTKQIRVECRAGAGTAVTPKLRNVTDSSDAGVGASCTGTAADYSGTNQKQTITVTIASGVKKYRLMGTPANTTDPTFEVGDLEIFATS